MLYIGILAMIGVGLSWIFIGIIMGRLTKEHISVDQLIFFSSALAVVITFLLAIIRPWPTASIWSITLTGSILFVGGIFNNRQLYYLGKAMSHGPNGIIWSITQSGFIVPFFVGVIFFAVPLTIWRISGALALFIAIYMLGQAKNNHGTYGKWRLYAFTAFAMTGISQSFSNLPSYLNEAEAVDSVWRTLFALLGMTLGTPLSAIFVGKWKTFCCETYNSLTNKRLWWYTLGVELFDIIGSIFLLYPGMNMLAKAQAGAIAYPLMVGACIAGFEIFSIFVLREKHNFWQFAALILCLFGVATICC